MVGSKELPKISTAHESDMIMTWLRSDSRLQSDSLSHYCLKEKEMLLDANKRKPNQDGFADRDLLPHITGSP